MKTIIRSIDRTITAEEIIPLLNKYGMLSRLAYEDIIDRAIAQIECTPQEIAIASELWQHQQNKSKTSPLNKEEFLASAIRNLKIEKFKQQNFSDGLPAYFTRGKKQLDRVIYSLVKTKTQEVAREMYFRLIEAEQTFAELAQERKENLQIEASEAIGWVELGTLPPLINSTTAIYPPSQFCFFSYPYWEVLRYLASRKISFRTMRSRYAEASEG